MQPPFAPPSTRVVRPPIVLNQDVVYRRDLIHKYVEYVARCGHPSPPPGADIDIVLRCFLLERLIFNGVVDMDAFEREYAAFAWFDKVAFENAVAVIRFYNSGRQEGSIQKVEVRRS